MGTLGVQPIWTDKVSGTIATVLNFDGDSDGYGHGDDMCEQSLNIVCRRQTTQPHLEEVYNGLYPNGIQKIGACVLVL